MSDMWALPNPEGSPIEKINYDVYLENIDPELRSLISDNPTKEEILRAFAYYHQNLLNYFNRHDDTFKYWANIHTHGSFGPGGGTVLPSPYLAWLDGIYDTNAWGWTPLGYPTSHGRAWSPDKTKQAIACAVAPHLRVYEAPAGTVEEPGWPVIPTVGSWSSLSSAGDVDWSPDGTRIVVAHPEAPYYTVIDVATKTAEPGWPAIDGTGFRCAWSPDGQYLALTHSGGATYTVIDVTTKTKVTGLPAVAGPPAGLSFSPDSNLLAMGVSGANTAQRPTLISLVTKLRATWLDAHTSWESKLVFLPDGVNLFVANYTDSGSSTSSDLGVVNINTEALVLGPVAGHTNIYSLAADPGGGRIAVGIRAGGAYVHDTTDLSVLAGPLDDQTSVAHGPPHAISFAYGPNGSLTT